MSPNRNSRARLLQLDRDFAWEKRVSKIIEETDFLSIDLDEMPSEVTEKMLYDFELHNVTDTVRNRELFFEAQQINQLLREKGIIPEQVAPTRDGRGYVRLDFNEMFKLLFNDEEA